MSHICETCCYQTNNNQHFDRHINSQKHIDAIKLLETSTILEKYNCLEKEKEDLVETLEEYKEKERELARALDKYIEASDEQKNKIRELKLEVKLLRESKKEIKEASSRPIIVNNKTTNNILAILSSEPIDHKQIQEAICKQLTTELVLKDDNAMANVFLEQFTDKEGKYKIACTDLSRQTFRYKDESGEMKVDPGLEIMFEGVRNATRDQYNKNIHMNLYDAAHIKVDKKGHKGLDIDYLMQLRAKARFKSRKVTKKIAQKTYIKAPIAKIKFEN